MLHTYGNSKAEGRELCFQRLKTAGQDYSLTFRGALGRGSKRLWQPLLREGTGCQPEASARSSAGCHTGFTRQPAGACGERCCFSKSRVYAGARWCGRMVCPNGVARVLQGCSVPLLSPSLLLLALSPWEGNPTGVGLSFRDKHQGCLA